MQGHEREREKTESHYNDNIFTTKNQKIQVNKKKKDQLFVGNKGSGNYKSTSVAPKSLGKSKGSRVSQEKTNRHR